MSSHCAMNLAQLRSALGRPAYEDEDVLLYHGDSLELLSNVPSKSIRLTITSPPYNIGKEYERVQSIDEYVKWTREWTKKIFNLTTDNGAFWLNLGYLSIAERAKAIPIPYLVWNQIDFFLVQEIVWNYGAGVAGKTFFSPRNEKFLWYVKNERDYTFNLDDVRDPNVKYPNQKKNGKLKCNPLGKNPSDVWQIAKVTSGANRSSKERTAHPAQFPLELVQRIMLASSHKNEIALDPFAGSASVLEAAILTGRKAIGIETEKKYVDIGVSRLRQARKSAGMLASQTSMLRSESLFDRDQLKLS